MPIRVTPVPRPYRDILKRKTIPARIVADFRPAPQVIHRIAPTHCGTSFLGLLTNVLTRQASMCVEG